MKRTIEISVIDMAGQAPSVGGDYFIEIKRDPAQPDFIERRYLSERRTARALEAKFTDDFCLQIFDNIWWTGGVFEATIRGKGLYSLTLRLSGNCVEFINDNRYSMGAFSCSLIHYAEGVKHLFRLLPGESYIDVSILFYPSFFMTRYGMTALEVESLLKPPHCRRLDPWFSQCRMTPQMEAIFHWLRGASPLDKLWRLHAEAKAIELISLYLEQLEQGATEPKGSPVSTRDRQRLYLLREYLSKHYSDPPSIADLCRRSGLNRRKLSEGFKHEFGRTVYEYLRYLRMEQARALFQSGSMDINQVAQHVGYGHQGNFAKAFKQYLGVSPRQFRVAQGAVPKNKRVPRA